MAYMQHDKPQNNYAGVKVLTKNQPNLCTCTIQYHSNVSLQSVVSLDAQLDSPFLHESRIQNCEHVIENQVDDRVT